ncbi:MAG: RNA polymerase sigma factor [Bdellovibrio sp.]|nr:RNA polymerase sigma factor [Bdellovibrio sp.]
MKRTEAQLLAICVSTQDRQAFGELVEMYQSPLRLVIRRWTFGNATLADDIAQEAFIKAYRGILKFRFESKFFTWLCQISYHAFIEHCRKKKLPEEVELPPEHNPTRGTDLHRDVEYAMKYLSEAERVAITLCFHKDLSHDEAATIMQMPLGTVKSHVNRAKEKMSKHLNAWREED